MSFSNNFFTFELISACSSKIAYFLRHKLNIIFCCESYKVIFPPKPLKSKIEKHTIAGNKEYRYPAKF